jgi:GNAT superfamily N-acetyltransferase
VHNHRNALLALNLEYMSWCFDGVEKQFAIPHSDIVGMPVHEYVATVIDKVCGDPPPKGVFYLIKLDGQLVGMGGLRRLGDGVAEIKRVYVRPECRGKNLGELILQRLIADAKAFGYHKLCLDTALFMTSAHRIYERNGFIDCAAYQDAEVPPEFHTRWRFMQREI